jgi:hypothetical protein
MDVRIVKVKDVFKPEDELMIIRIGEFMIIKKHKTLSDILNDTSKRFEDLSEEDKERLAIEAKKWVREKLR